MQNDMDQEILYVNKKKYQKYYKQYVKQHLAFEKNVKKQINKIG